MKSVRVAIVVAGFFLAVCGCRNHSEPVRGPQAAACPFQAAERTDQDVDRGAERVFHCRGCPSAAKISPSRRIGWPAAEAAQAAGYRPCKRCRPDRPAWESQTKPGVTRPATTQETEP